MTVTSSRHRCAAFGSPCRPSGWGVLT